MKIIQFFKIMRELRKIARDLPQQINEERERYCGMTTGELNQLSDEDLFVAADMRISTVLSDYEEFTEGFAALNSHQKVFCAVNLLEMEVNNGGLCQFFVNSSRTVAPFISGYLEIIGADSHKELFDGFISKYRIDLNDLASFMIRRTRDFEKMTKRYPFDEYDDAFYDLESLEGPLTAYIRANVDAF